MKVFFLSFVVCSLALASVDSRALAQDAPRPPAPTVVGTHPDEGLMIAGGVTFLAGYLVAALTIASVHPGYCDQHFSGAESPEVSCTSIAWGFTPIVHILAGGWDGLIAGSVGLFIEFIGLLIFTGGAAHHHPNQPRAPGTVAFRASVPGADVGVGMDLAF